MSQKLVLYYDEACPRCSWWAKWLRRIGGTQLELCPLRTEGLQQPDIDPETALEAIPARTAEGNVLYGFDALRAVIDRIWWLWPLWLPAFLMQRSGLGRRLYFYFASRRLIVGCQGTNCSKSAAKSK